MAVTWRQAVTAAARLLAESGVPTPEVDARLLAEHAAGVDHLVLAPRPDQEALGRYAQLVERRRGREPVQHITGRMYFRHLVLRSSPGAFVVRPETEVVAEAAIDAARAVADAAGTVNDDDAGTGADDDARTSMRRERPSGPRRPLVVDLCTGSGAIALAVATEVPGAQVHAVELSPRALAVAGENVAALAPHVHLVAADAAHALPELDGLVDVVVANPPYIPPDAVPVEPEVREHDPDQALYGGGPDGLHVPRAVVATAARLLRPGGVLVMEHAEVQAEAVRSLVLATGLLTDVRTGVDLTGRDRFVVARRR